MRISLNILCLLCATLLVPMTSHAAGKGKGKGGEEEAKTVSGMSIVGNNEAPKSLYIVPWKSSELGGDTEMKSGVLTDAMTSVDREVFMRQLDFYEISKGN